MSAIDEHPLRIARIRAGLTAEKLGSLSGVSRGTINALEQGRIKTPRPEIVVQLALANSVDPVWLARMYAEWLGRFERSSLEGWSRIESELTPKARAVLALDPAVVPRYGSFANWRRDIHPSVAGFASLLMVSATTLRRFERGDTSMPKPLVRALQKGLRLSDEYLASLMGLDGSDPASRTREFWKNRKRVSRQREAWVGEGDVRGQRDHRDPLTFVVAPVGQGDD